MSDALSAELAEYEYQIEQISGALEATPDNDELLTLKKELQDLADLTRARLSNNEQNEASEAKISVVDTDKKRKLETQEVRKVGDQVLAKWIGGDHQFYAARITSITGNQSDPLYTVKFSEYNEVQTLRGHQMRNLNEFKKRALESGATSRTTNPPPPPPVSVDGPDRKTSGTPEKVTKVAKKKTSTTKDDLAKSASSWNAFAQSAPKTKRFGKRTAIGESSMFRTDENGRVGVIGSGRAMTADPGKRTRHVYRSDN